MLGAFLVCSGRWEVVYRFLDYADDEKQTLLLPAERSQHDKALSTARR
jgi:hypothetical protein